jgi:hypothetical protein
MARTNRDRAFSSLQHVIDMEWMQEAYYKPARTGWPAAAWDSNLRGQSGAASDRCCWSRSTTRTSCLARTDSGQVRVFMMRCMRCAPR